MARQEEKTQPRTRLELGLVFLFAMLSSGCSSHYCGAPCDPAPRKPPPVRHESVVNQYGSVFGYLEVDTMTMIQLRTEKASLELLLGQDPKDGEILKALKDKDDSAFDFAYNDYSTGGSRFNANGKLRRDAAVKNPERKIPRMISESQNRELFERYRRVRLRIPVLARRLALAPPPDTAAPTPSDTLWSGFFRADQDTLSPGPGKFPALGECLAWGEGKAESFRQKAYAFEYECRRSAESVKRKIW
ncbi:MAG: hypothetical protein JWO30_1280 [Fibrobacteres bacterium]|nr:hypothetical protein [Fibrobacterota bacterium]